MIKSIFDKALRLLFVILFFPRYVTVKKDIVEGAIIGRNLSKVINKTNEHFKKIKRDFLYIGYLIGKEKDYKEIFEI